MCDDSDSECDLPPDFCDTPELQAAWRRVEAFDASQAVSEKLGQLAATLERVAEIIDAEDSVSLNWARTQLETWRERMRDMPPSTSRTDFELLDDEALSFMLGEPKLRAAYDVANGMEMLEVVVPQLESLRAQGERGPLRADELDRMHVLEELQATLNEEVRNGLRRLRSLD